MKAAGATADGGSGKACLEAGFRGPWRACSIASEMKKEVEDASVKMFAPAKERGPSARGEYCSLEGVSIAGKSHVRGRSMD